MLDGAQTDLFSEVDDLGFVRILLAELHDDLVGKVSRFRQLNDLSATLGQYGTMLPGGETAVAAWTEARASYVHGNYMATIMLCQGLAEHILAAQLSLGLNEIELPNRIKFQKTLELCLGDKLIGKDDAVELERLMELRNPLSHFRGINDPSNLSRRVLNSVGSPQGYISAERHLFNDASFAIGVIVRLLSLPLFRVDQ